MRWRIISFTAGGIRLSEKTAELLGDRETLLYTKYAGTYEPESEPGRRPDAVSYVRESIGDWAEAQLRERNVLLFIGACQIAVRAVAPYLTDKLQDPPVLVMDERGSYVIPILSGHIGGANELAVLLAGKLGAEPVITTATDINRKFAVDLFAKRNGLAIARADKAGIAKISSMVLDGKEIIVSVEPGHISGTDGEWGKDKEAKLPTGIRLTGYPPGGTVNVVITSEEKVFPADLLLRPKEYAIGIGCRKGKEADQIRSFIQKGLTRLGISSAQVFALASVSRKSGEPGLLAWSQEEGIPFLTYPPEELELVEGTFRESEFVKQTVGVANVCERAALKACGSGGTLALEKYAENGMTMAVAKREWSVVFDENGEG